MNVLTKVAISKYIFGQNSESCQLHISTERKQGYCLGIFEQGVTACNFLGLDSTQKINFPYTKSACNLLDTQKISIAFPFLPLLLLTTKEKWKDLSTYMQLVSVESKSCWRSGSSGQWFKIPQEKMISEWDTQEVDWQLSREFRLWNNSEKIA